jgi:hypothetical protein
MTADPEAAHEHARILFGDDDGGYQHYTDPSGWCSTFAKRGNQKTCRAFAGREMLEQLPSYATALATAGYDAYVAPGLRSTNPGPERRGGNDDVLGLPAVWFDLDVAGPTHTQSDLPATIDNGLALLAAQPLEPTLVVHSGAGLQAYWCFSELQIIESADDRTLASNLSHAFQRFLIQEGTERGWKLDDTSDLARALRLAGTFNYKTGQPVPVRIIYASEARYTPADLLVMCAKPDPPSRKASTFVQRPAGARQGSADVETRIRGCLKVVGPWAPGNRDACAFSMAAFLRNQLQLPAFEALDWLRRLNGECSDPLEDSVLVDKIERLWAA